MKLLPDWLSGGNDRELANTTYAGRESATARATRKADEKSASRRASHRSGGAQRAAREGQRWTARQRDFRGE